MKNSFAQIRWLYLASISSRKLKNNLFPLNSNIFPSKFSVFRFCERQHTFQLKIHICLSRLYSPEMSVLPKEKKKKENEHSKRKVEYIQFFSQKLDGLETTNSLSFALVSI